MCADGIWGNIFMYGRKQESLAEILRNVPLFHNLAPRELRILQKLVHVRTYQTDEAVFVENEPGAGMYVICHGRIDIVLNREPGNRIVLAELEAGDFFGEMALLGETSRSAAAVAREQSQLIGFFHPELEEIIGLHPVMGAKISFGLAKTLSERLRYTNAQLRDGWVIQEAT
jgi:CRP/FNR family transcriptional regulator, cyclic AMP receptor protein